MIVYFAFGSIFSLGARAECGAAARAFAPSVQAMQNSTAVSPEALSPQADWLQAQADAGLDISIIRLWKAIWVSSGTIVDVGFDQWHSDRTEILNDSPLPPAATYVWERGRRSRREPIRSCIPLLISMSQGRQSSASLLNGNRLQFPQTATISRVSSPGIRMTLRGTRSPAPISLAP